MSTTKQVRTTRDTYASQDRVADTPNTETTVRVRATTTSHGRQAFLAFGQIPIGAQIVAATLHAFHYAALTGSRVFTFNRITTPWAARSLSWNNRPTTVTTNQATVTVGTVAAGAELVATLTAMVQDAANGSAWYGVRITSDEDVGRWLYSADAGREERHPYLEIIYSTKPAPPTDLSPVDGMYVGINKPVVSWSFGDPARSDATQTAAQVLVASDSAFTVALFDTGKVTTADQQLDLATTAYGGATADSMRYWKVRTWNDDDVPSDYSDVGSFMYHALGTVTIANPPVGGVVNDVTPVIAWTVASMTQEAFRVIVERLGTDGVWVEQADSDRVVSTALSWTIPEDAHLDEGITYRVTVRVWDSLAREPGTGSYASAVRNPTTYARVAGVTAPAGLTATANGAGVVLQWTRGSTPDYWALAVNGVIVMPRIDGASLFVSGTTYRLTYWRAKPRVSLTYEVMAGTVSGGNITHSQANPTVAFTSDPIGITLADEDTSQAVWIAGEDSWGAEVAESSQVYMPLGRRSPILVTDMVRGYEGTVTGVIVGSPSGVNGVTNPGVDAQTARDVLLALRTPGRHLRLVIGDRNVPIKVYQVTALPMPTPGDRQFSAAFSFFQTDEYDIAWRT